ncbi:hypothetical protein L7F22_047538 [Adiantum nelumboides]|nr:hypothetical protein [Adiantum nelumboides]
MTNGNKDIIMVNHMGRMKNNDFVCNIGQFANEIDMRNLEVYIPWCQEDNHQASEDCQVFPETKTGIIVLDKLGCIMRYQSPFMSCSFTNQLELWKESKSSKYAKLCTCFQSIWMKRGGPAYSVSKASFKEYRLGGYSLWFQGQVGDAGKWGEMAWCLRREERVLGVVNRAMTDTGNVHSGALQVVTRYMQQNCHRGSSPSGYCSARSVYIHKEGIIQYVTVNNLAIAVQYAQDNSDEECPTGWKPGEKTMKPDTISTDLDYHSIISTRALERTIEMHHYEINNKYELMTSSQLEWLDTYQGGIGNDEHGEGIQQWIDQCQQKDYAIFLGYEMDVPFQLIDADELDALEVAITAAERSSSTCRKRKFSIPSSSSYTSCGDMGSDSLCDSTIPAKEPWERSTESSGKSNGCDIIHGHSEDETSCGLSNGSNDEVDAARFIRNAAGEGERACQGRLLSNAHEVKCDGDVDGSMLCQGKVDDLSRAPSSSNAGLIYEAEEATAFSLKETHSKPRCSRRLPLWQSYASSHQPKNERGHTKIIESLKFDVEKVQFASPADFTGDLHIDNSGLPWGLEPSACRVGPKCKLPHLQFKGHTIYSVSALDAKSAAYELLRQVEARKAGGILVPLGFDTEWKVVFKRGAQARKVAVLQLCINADQCNVFHVIHTGIPPPLRTILEDPLVAKVGIGAYGDAARLFTDYNVKVKGVKDLSGLANLKLGGAACARRSWSLSSLTENLIGKQVDKNASIRMGDWEVDKLSEAQLQYAATDAFASLYLFQVLLTFPDPQKKDSPAIDCNTVTALATPQEDVRKHQQSTATQ